MTDKTMEMPEAPTIATAVEATQVELRFAGIGIVRADDVRLANGGAGLVFAGQHAELERAGARSIISGGPVTITRGGAGMIAAAGGATISQGGGGTIVVLGDLKLDHSGGAMLVSKSASVGEGGFVGLALTTRLNVEPGGRVLLGVRQMAVMGVVATVVTALTFGLVRVLGRPGR